MPVPRLRGRDDEVDYVIVRRTEEDALEDTAALEARFEPTTTVDGALDSSLTRRQSYPSAPDFEADDSDDDDGADEDSMSLTTGPPPILVTMTLPQAQATGSASNPGETVVLKIPPPPRPPHRGGISKTTEHLLIAAGSIGATIIVVMIILAIHTMRKRGLTLREAVRHGRYQVTRRAPPPPPPKARQWDAKPESNNDYGSMRKDTVTPPARAMSMARSGSMSSQRPLMALQRNESFTARQYATDRSTSPETVPQSFYLESPVRSASHRRNNSQTPSSPVLPLQTQRRSASTRNTRSMSNASELKYPEPPVERALSPLPPPPTFKQFLFNRPSVSGKQGNGAMVSRFSWTNSNAPQTPHDPSRDTNSHVVGRDSFMTQRSSVPRFRTVDSWVNQQANRIEEQKLRDQFRMTQSTVHSSDDERDDSIPEVPEIPSYMNTGTSVTLAKPLTPPPLRSAGLPGKNVKHERHDTRTTIDTAPIFRQHPGTEVRFSTRSVVPSEILDMGRRPNVLS